jgi:hypothetical protein
MAVFHDQDWERSQSMNVQKAKPYQKPKQLPNPHQKGKQWVQDELHFEDKQYPWRETPLTDTEIEKLFWGKLVQLGWRLHIYEEKNIQKKNIVLPCYECNKLLDSYSWVSITRTNAVKMSDDKNVKGKVESHGGFICQAIPEATPEA